MFPTTLTVVFNGKIWLAEIRWWHGCLRDLAAEGVTAKEAVERLREVFWRHVPAALEQGRQREVEYADMLFSEAARSLTRAQP